VTAVRYPCLNGLRALAALAVVTTHAAFWTGAYTPDLAGFALARLDVGVAVFFTLSGFLLSQPMLRAAAEGRPAPRTAAYLWRRALRILPAYWLCVALALLFLPDNQGATAGTWLRFLTLTQIYSRDWHAAGLDHAWSLCTEVAFYLLLPLLVRGLLAVSGGWRPARLVACLGVLSVLGSGWSLWAAGDPLVLGSLTLWLPAYLSWFAAGMATAVLTLAAPGWGPVRLVTALGSGPWTCWAAAVAVFWVAASPLTGSVLLDEPLTGPQVVVKHALYTVVAALVVLPLVFGDQRQGLARRFLASRPMHWAGEISYGVFLFHMLLLVSFWDLFTHPLPVVLAGTLAVSVVAAGVSYLCLERPLVQRLRRVVPDRPPVRAADRAVDRNEDAAQALAP
jgi:peptidoglycan/LPS O-acetylase OafA/YrhL